ncbi:MAG: UvrD-helicase domain-containing protein [Anaerolineales bacterium]
MVILSKEQENILNQPIAGQIFLSGSAGNGKTTVGVQRMMKLLDEGHPGHSILVLAPQQSLIRAYENTIQEHQVFSNSKVNFMTIGSIARKIVELFWPFALEYGEFNKSLNQPPIFLSLETAQYHMARVVQPLLEKGYFASIVIDHNRLYSQILDNLNKSAFVGFPHSEIGSRLDRAWMGETAQQRVFHDVQDCANQFREYCLKRNLLDYSLLMETFWQILRPLPIVQNYLQEAYRHLIYDNVEEDTPRAHDIILEMMDGFSSSLVIYDNNGGYRKYLGADPVSATRLKEKCGKSFHLDKSFVMSKKIEDLAHRFQIQLDGRPRSSHLSQTEKRANIPITFTPDSRFFPQMLDWVTDEVNNLVTDDGIPPSEIAILAPYLSDSLRFSIFNRFEARGIPIQSLRPSRSLRDEPASQAILTLAKLCHPAWRMIPASSDIGNMLFFCIKDMDLVRAQLLASNIVQQKNQQLSSFDLIKPDIQARITYMIGNRYEQMRNWIEDYQKRGHQSLDHFIRRLFGELLSQPGFGFHRNPDASRTAANLIKSIKYFRSTMTLEQNPEFDDEIDLGIEYVNLLYDGVIAAQYSESWFSEDEDAVLLSPAHTFLMMNKPITVQFWLDPGSNGWFERLNQPLTHPYVLSRNWEEESREGHVLWSDADELSSNQQALQHLVDGLLHRCKEHLYLGISNFNESGFEQQGIMLKTLQHVLQSYSGS